MRPVVSVLPVFCSTPVTVVESSTNPGTVPEYVQVKVTAPPPGITTGPAGVGPVMNDAAPGPDTWGSAGSTPATAAPPELVTVIVSRKVWPTSRGDGQAD